MLGHTSHTIMFVIFLAFGLEGRGCLFDAGHSDRRVWMSIAPIKCGGNAWQMEDKSIEDYLEDRGAEVFDLRKITFATVGCEACGCLTGERVDVLVDDDDIDILLAEGFYRWEDWPYRPNDEPDLQPGSASHFPATLPQVVASSRRGSRGRISNLQPLTSNLNLL